MCVVVVGPVVVAGPVVGIEKGRQRWRHGCFVGPRSGWVRVVLLLGVGELSLCTGARGMGHCCAPRRHLGWEGEHFEEHFVGEGSFVARSPWRLLCEDEWFRLVVC